MSNSYKYNLIFAGTPEFALPSLKGLIRDDSFNILAVITQPDRKAGRGQKITAPPIKKLAQKNNIPVLQPEKIEKIEKEISEFRADALVVVSYGQIIPERILNLPKHGSFNFHGSLLPRYRGAGVIAAPILNEDEYTGVTLMKMDAGLDTGPIIKQNKIKLDKEETLKTLHDKLSQKGAEILVTALKEYLEGKIKPQPQKEEEASYAPKLNKQDGKIDWQENAKIIEKKVRALNPVPGTHTKLNGKNLKIKEVEHRFLPINKFPVGKLFLFKNKLAVQCGQNALIIKKLQLEGGKEMSAPDFLKGHPDVEGKILA